MVLKERREQYIKGIEQALATNPHARAFYFPDNWHKRQKMNQRLGREIGFGLAPFLAMGFNDLYSRIVVRNSFARGCGVVIDCGEFAKALHEGARKAELT